MSDIEDDWKQQKDKYFHWKLKNDLRMIRKAWLIIIFSLLFGFLGGIGYAKIYLAIGL